MIAKSSPASSFLLPSGIGGEGKERVPHPVSLGGGSPSRIQLGRTAASQEGPKLSSTKPLCKVCIEPVLMAVDGEEGTTLQSIAFLSVHSLQDWLYVVLPQWLRKGQFRALLGGRRPPQVVALHSGARCKINVFGNPARLWPPVTRCMNIRSPAASGSRKFGPTRRARFCNRFRRVCTGL